MNPTETQIVIYKKADLDRVIELLDSLSFQGNVVRNAQLITAIVQTLQTKGTAQTVNTTPNMEETDNASRTEADNT